MKLHHWSANRVLEFPHWPLHFGANRYVHYVLKGCLQRPYSLTATLSAPGCHDSTTVRGACGGIVAADLVHVVCGLSADVDNSPSGVPGATTHEKPPILVCMVSVQARTSTASLRSSPYARRHEEEHTVKAPQINTLTKHSIQSES